MTSVILQARLDSTRLPRKALLDLSGKPVIVRAMESLARVGADSYILACDEASGPELAPLAESCGFRCITGPKEDVLARFCMAVAETGTTTVIRATGDNPFVFADAAAESLKRFIELQSGPEPADYFTFTGMPHGSGVEIFSGKRLLEAAALTDSPYDREHVGPALYNHADRFTCVREPAPQQWSRQEARVTIDTAEDYERAQCMARYLAAKGKPLPAESADVLSAWNYAARPILLVPAPRPGTGHLTRCASLAHELSETRRVLVWIPSSAEERVIESIKPFLVDEPPVSAALVVADLFRSSPSLMERLGKIGPVVSLDDGGKGRDRADYLLDIIPGLPGSCAAPNRTDPALLNLPKKRKRDHTRKIESVLVAAGGDNAAGLAIPAAEILSRIFSDVTVIDPALAGVGKNGPESERAQAVSAERADAPAESAEAPAYRVIGPVPELRERLSDYDLVVTHFGFTAFEALAAGCRVLLFSPTGYHYRLARAWRFPALPPERLRTEDVLALVRGGLSAPKIIGPDTAAGSLSREIDRLAEGKVLPCPLCGEPVSRTVSARHAARTVVRCDSCRMTHLRFFMPQSSGYGRSYFFEEYQTQYGKTYLEDFESIKARSFERLASLEAVSRRSLPYLRPEERTVLDVGCAYGPFLDAARDKRWIPFGTDISESAVEYVRDTLGIPAVRAAFPALEDGIPGSPDKFAAVTFWFVIEHFPDLEPVLERARKLLVPGGVLAFSTPSAAGISARANRASFLERSPADHYTIWDPRLVKKQLARYGFTVKKIVSTGHHPERFPRCKGLRSGSPLWSLLFAASRLLSLGDTFEVYAVRNGRLEDAE